MSGHSKWATTKVHKFAQDAKRSKMFQKFSKEIMVAATQGGPNPDANPALKLAIAKAKSRRMPKANIEKAIAKVAGDAKGSSNFTSLVYSGTAFGGVNFLVSCLTDNFNRLASNIKHYFTRVNGTLGKQGTVPYTFDYKGLIEIDSSIAPEDKVMEIVLEAGADDFVVEDNTYIIYTSPAAFSAVKQALDEQLKIENYLSSEVNYFPNSEVNLPEDKVEQFEKFVELLEDDDDVQEVIHNAIY